MGYLSCFTRLFLTLFNGVTITICLVFTGIGVVMIILPDISVLDHLIGASTVMTKLKDTLTATGLGTEDQYSGLSLSTAFYDVGLMLAASCVFIMIIALFGCCGGCCKLKCALLTYIAVSCFFLVLELIVVIIVYGDEDLVIKSIKELVLLSIASYKGLAGQNIQSLGWNFVMVKYKCCGLNDYKDFLSSNWTRSVTTSGTTYTLKTPIACCDPLPTSGDLTCATTTSEPNTALTGCFDTVWDTSFGNDTFIAFGYCIGFGIQASLLNFRDSFVLNITQLLYDIFCVFQLILIAAAIIVFMEAKKKNRIATEREERKHRRMANNAVVEPLPEKPGISNNPFEDHLPDKPNAHVYM
uniref:Tetraspanin n=1 Tax=Magallana gigas TaxID=29159 RepID=A0A8W8LFS9_MAGGI